MGHQRGRKPLLEFVELGVFVADLSPVKDPAPQQLKTLKSDLLSHPPALSEPLFFHHSLKNPCCALCPGFVQKAFCASQ